MSYAKLRGKIREVFGTQEKYAKAIGLDVSAVNAKLNNKSPWKREEIEKSMDALNIPIEYVYEYFFTPKVAEKQ